MPATLIKEREPEYIIRVRIELEELQLKTTKLAEFIDGDVFTTLSHTEQRLLSAQYGAMLAYEQILVIRLSLW